MRMAARVALEALEALAPLVERFSQAGPVLLGVTAAVGPQVLRAMALLVRLWVVLVVAEMRAQAAPVRTETRAAAALVPDLA